MQVTGRQSSTHDSPTSFSGAGYAMLTFISAPHAKLQSAYLVVSTKFRSWWLDKQMIHAIILEPSDYHQTLICDTCLVYFHSDTLLSEHIVQMEPQWIRRFMGPIRACFITPAGLASSGAAS